MHLTGDAELVLVGDQLVAHADWNRWLPDRTVRVFAEPGMTSDLLLEREDELLALAPEAIAMLIGTNDFSGRRTAEHVVRNVQHLLIRLRRLLPGTRLLLMSIPPRTRELAETIQDANRHLRQFAPSVRAQYLDLWPALALVGGEIDPAASVDGLTLTERGYEMWSAELRPAVDRLDEAPPMSGAITIIAPPPADDARPD